MKTKLLLAAFIMLLPLVISLIFLITHQNRKYELVRANANFRVVKYEGDKMFTMEIYRCQTTMIMSGGTLVPVRTCEYQEVQKFARKNLAIEALGKTR